ncbi:hypothetical protein F5Y03DRAFT_373290 [Xylaria venustula]|nr:hypothetical protein F5Y03DRAFT_373290 [Xylaria venustula]
MRSLRNSFFTISPLLYLSACLTGKKDNPRLFPIFLIGLDYYGTAISVLEHRNTIPGNEVTTTIYHFKCIFHHSFFFLVGVQDICIIYHDYLYIIKPRLRGTCGLVLK